MIEHGLAVYSITGNHTGVQLGVTLLAWRSKRCLLTKGSETHFADVAVPQ